MVSKERNDILLYLVRSNDAHHFATIRLFFLIIVLKTKASDPHGFTCFSYIVQRKVRSFYESVSISHCFLLFGRDQIQRTHFQNPFGQKSSEKSVTTTCSTYVAYHSLYRLSPFRKRGLPARGVLHFCLHRQN
ncbi:hypothetical protein GCWU000325_02455 [Alloprevotella tannerae ATCC 51259]|uniref:Uncharacterized protein n=1 Tax=Alloprevotella tannerae ATCC 51259 TaxID=626522 RepID=C9LJP2_9BACT|nr:hypothetical protein GCWU000325_02455 [Alloprevotella tannerae ATCC 51259]